MNMQGMNMQKAGLFTALAMTVAVAAYAYPKSDRSDTVAKIGSIGSERDGSQPTPLDKLKAATKVGINPQDMQVALPPPKVMDSVKQEIQTRSAAADTVTVGPKAASAVESQTAKSGIDKLAAKLAPSPEAPLPITAVPHSAPTQASTIAIPTSTTPVVAPAPVGAAEGEAKSNAADAAPVATKPAKATTPEKRRAPQREAGADIRNPAPARFVRSNTFKPNEGM
jgi:hypothetical protein